MRLNFTKKEDPLVKLATRNEGGEPPLTRVKVLDFCLGFLNPNLAFWTKLWYGLTDRKIYSTMLVPFMMCFDLFDQN